MAGGGDYYPFKKIVNALISLIAFDSFPEGKPFYRFGLKSLPLGEGVIPTRRGDG